MVGLGSIAWTAKFNVLGTGAAATHPELTFPVAAKHTLALSVDYLRQMVGFFGWLDVRPPFHLAGLWFIPVLALIAAAALAGKLRDVAALVLLAGSVIAIPVLAQGRQAASLGYIWQGRYLLAVAVGLPLLAAAILAKREPRRGWLKQVVSRLPLAVTASTLLLGFLMFYTTLRRYAVGTRGSMLLLNPAWTPPGTVLGVVLLYLVGAGLAALVVLKSWAPYPEGVTVTAGDDEGIAALVEAEVAVVAVPAQVAANGNGNGNGKAHHAIGSGKAINGSNGSGSTLNGSGKAAHGSSAVIEDSASEDRGPAIASAS
jgi:hypothetical protein